MNVKPNDMARVEGAYRECDNGLIVEVLRAAQPTQWGLEWVCKPAWPCAGELVFGNNVIGRNFNADEMAIPDAWLRPIRPEADPVTTENHEEVSA